MHPARLPPEELWKHCLFRTTRRSGPGGQHRNKVETAVVITFTPGGISAEANERRSQLENRKEALWRLRLRLACEIRTEDLTEYPSDLWLSRIENRRLHISASHDDYPAMIAEALDILEAENQNLPVSAERLQVSTSQLVRLFRLDGACWKKLNDLRAQKGLPHLKST